MGRVVELRGPCRIMAAELVGGAVVRWKCPRCTKASGKPSYHLFDARTGRLVGERLPHAEPRQHGAGDGESDREAEGGVLAPVAAT